MNKVYTSFFYKPWVVFLLLIDFLFVEFYYEEFLKKFMYDYFSWPFQLSGWDVFFVVALFLLLVGIISGRLNDKYKLSSSTLRQLINNALGYKWLTLFILFFFIMHFSWAIDAGYEFFVNTDFEKQNWMEIFHIVVPTCGMFFAALLIPVRQEKERSLSEADILLSSFSVSKSGDLLPGNLDLFFKPFLCGVYYNSDTLEQLKGIKKILIIPSVSLLNAPIRMDAVDNDNWDKLIDKLWENNDEIKKVYSENAIVEQQDAKHLYRATVYAAKDKYNEAVRSNHSIQNFDRLKELLSAILPLEFIFSEIPVNYDQFDQVFKEAFQLLRVHEEHDSKTLIHISPGTSIPAGALTALGVKKNRTIIYTLQNKENTLCSVNIDVDSMNDWLSELIDDRDEKIIE